LCFRFAVAVGNPARHRVLGFTWNLELSVASHAQHQLARRAGQPVAGRFHGTGAVLGNQRLRVADVCGSARKQLALGDFHRALARRKLPAGLFTATILAYLQCSG
jgi:hypothetical protein